MRKAIRFGAVVLALLTAVPTVAMAQSTRTPGLDQREATQQHRINQGVRSGELTRHETRKLEHGQANLRRNEARAKADGVVTHRERVQLQHQADRQSARIAHEKNDAQTR